MYETGQTIPAALSELKILFLEVYGSQALGGFLNGVLTSLLICSLIVLTKSTHGKFTANNGIGPQTLHEGSTPRVGGAAILTALTVALVYSPPPDREFFSPILISTLPAFVFGLAEDLSGRVSWKQRLVGTLASALVFCSFTGAIVTRVDIPLLDGMLGYLPLATVFTVVAISGISNSFNMIDGLHGLSAGTAVICLTAVSLLSGYCGDTQLMTSCMTIVSVLIGFLFVNYPFGKIFLGDGGAYLVGTLVAGYVILLSVRNPEISPFVSLTIVSYPTIEVMNTVLRRMKRNPKNLTRPDRLHLHSLLKLRVSEKLLPTATRTTKNAVTTPVLWCLVTATSIGACLVPHDSSYLIMIIVAEMSLYGIIYARLVTFSWRGIFWTERRKRGPDS